MQEFIKKNAQGPCIDTEVVFLLEDHLWSHILISPTEGFALQLNFISCPAQVTNFDIESVIEEDVLRLNREEAYFEVTVHDVVGMEVPNC